MRIEYTVGSGVIHETGFDDTFYYFGNERQIRDWPIVREFFFVQCWFLKQWVVKLCWNKFSSF